MDCKSLFFCLGITTAVGSKGSIGSFQRVREDQDVVNVVADLGILFYYVVFTYGSQCV